MSESAQHRGGGGETSPQQWVGWEAPGVAGALFQHATDALLLVDPLSERILDANDLACSLCALGREELLGTPLRMLLRHAEGWQDWPSAQESNFVAKEGFQLRAGQPDRWLEVGVRIHRVPLPGAGLIALVALTDRREQAELARRLNRADAELRCILANASDGLWSCRVERAGGWRYRYLSPGVQRLTGRNVAVFLGDPRAWEGCVDPEDLPAWRRFRAGLQAGGSAAAEYRLRGPGGAVVWARENVVATPDEGGWVLTGVLTDISGRKREAGGASPAPRDRLDGAAAVAATVAHSFNNLLTCVLGHVSLARLAGPASENLDRIEEITLRAAELCKQLTGVAGKARSAGPTQEVAAAVGKALGPWESRPGGPAVRVETAANLPAVLLDERLLGQVVEALVRNAAEATEGPGGEILVRVGATPPAPGVSGGGAPNASQGPPSFSYPAPDREGPAVWIEVRDNGPGIPEEVLARLGEPGVAARPGHGGWGLALVLGILRGNQGGLEIFTGRGRGTVVRVLLPAGTAPAGPAQAAKVEAAGEQSRGTVLLADDEEAVRDVAARLLQAAGCDVVAVRDGEEALAWLGRHSGEARLAIVDLTMPRLSGESLLRELRRLAPELPVVVMSGHPEGEALARFGEWQPAGYLQKPFRLPALVELLGRLLPAAPAGKR